MGNNSVPKFIFRLSRFPVYRGSVLGRFYCSNNGLPLVPIPSRQIQSTPCLPTYWWPSPITLFPSGFPTKHLHLFVSIMHATDAPFVSIMHATDAPFLDFITPVIFDTFKWCQSSQNFLQPHFTSGLFGPNTSLCLMPTVYLQKKQHICGPSTGNRTVKLTVATPTRLSEFPRITDNQS